MLIQNKSEMVQNRSGMVPDTSQTLLGHFWEQSVFQQNANKSWNAHRSKDRFFQNTYGHESPNMASKTNVLQQKSLPRAKLFGAGVIVPWDFFVSPDFVVGPKNQDI